MMDITEALELAREITDPDDGGVETLMDHGCDVIATMRVEIERLAAENNSLRGWREECDGMMVSLSLITEERDRLQRACDEGLPRERIDCPACGKPHVEWFRHDAPGIDGRTRPHHTHRCYHCEHVWDSGRWSFGVDVPPPSDADLIARCIEAAETLRGRALTAEREAVTANDFEAAKRHEVAAQSYVVMLSVLRRRSDEPPPHA